jgi:hypothetical protein
VLHIQVDRKPVLLQAHLGTARGGKRRRKDGRNVDYTDALSSFCRLAFCPGNASFSCLLKIPF